MDARARIAIEFALLWGLWTLFTDSLHVWELVFGAVAAMLATTVHEIVRRQPDSQFQWRWPWVLLAWRLPGEIVLANWRVLRRAGRTGGGALVSLPFRQIEPAQAALAECYGSMPPDSLVLGFGDSSQRIVLHQISPSSLSPILRRLGGS